jgi:GMP synthase (glutamine-hydrolysing)
MARVLLMEGNPAAARAKASQFLAVAGGLQISVVVAGSMVARNPQRAEMGIARKIALTDEGRAHPMLSGRAAAFDAPCIHFNNAIVLPRGAGPLAGNAHCSVQTAVIPIGHSEVWAVQYRPEFDLRHVAGLFRYSDISLVENGFSESQAVVESYADDLDVLATGQADQALAWCLVIDTDLTVDRMCHREILNWIDTMVERRDMCGHQEQAMC